MYIYSCIDTAVLIWNNAWYFKYILIVREDWFKSFYLRVLVQKMET